MPRTTLTHFTNHFKCFINGLLLGCCCAGISQATIADPGGVSFGLGMGALYNGLGVNLGVQGADDFTYLSLGCIGFSHTESEHIASGPNGSTTRTSESDWDGNCGLGAGYIKQGLFGLSKKHAFGAALGATYNEEYDRNEGYVGLSYQYFFNGSNGVKGWHVGLTPVLRFYESSSEGHLMINLGYQF